ncbi:ferrochelatase, partial [bacterium]|nr:ferrochelatase [bacterium]
MIAPTRQGALLVNLGTPDAPTTPALRRYLREFLSDPYVVDIPAIPRFLLVNGIIVPFRAPKSAHAYQAIWTENGSPLRHYTQSLAEMVKDRLSPDSWHIQWAMRYGNPGLTPALEALRNQGVERLTVLPLYPQFAQSTVTSTVVEIHRVLKKLKWSPEVRVIEPFYAKSDYLHATAEQIRPLLDDP